MKYKINTNDNINATNKDITNLEKNNKITKMPNASYRINVKKNKKKTILLFSLYLFAFGSVTVTTVLLLNSNITFNNSEFNPSANNSLWEDYYNKHHHNSTPISLDSTVKYFGDSKAIMVNVTKKPNDNDYLDFASVLSNIDNNLQNAQPNKIESDIDNDNPDLLPINFFLNVNYNPAVNFTVGDKKLPITADSFIVPKNFNSTTDYVLNVATNSQAPIFGIKNANLNFQIKITIKNQIAINISDLSFNFANQTISINNPNSATIESIKKQWLIPNIEDAVATTLSKALYVAKAQINPNYYKINFIDETTPKDFTKPVDVQFSITTDNAEKNPWNFNGTKPCTIKVQNEIANLNDMTDLTSAIEKKYDVKDDANHDKNFQITLDNNKDVNADNNLSDDDVKFVNGEIIKGVQEICNNYFKTHYSNLDISVNDYTVATDLGKGADIFNKKLGKNIKITITANDKSSKLHGTLNNINAIVHGHNKNNITNSYDSPKGFALDGIWLKDGKDKDILQEGQHFYEQNNLLDNWITNAKSLVNTVKDNSYQPIADSFSGTFTMNYQLDVKNEDGVTVNLSDINEKTTGGKVVNFWDLMTKTKSIFLETDVATTSGWTLNNVKLIFTNSEGQPTTDNTLYTLDLSNKFNGIAVTDRATLKFPDFNFNFKYQVKS